MGQVSSPIESHRKPVLGAIGIAVDRLSGKIGWIVKLGSRIPCGGPDVAVATMPEGQRTAEGTVAILVVERQNAVGRVTRRPDGELSKWICACGIRIDIERSIRSGTGSDRCATFL